MTPADDVRSRVRTILASGLLAAALACGAGSTSVGPLTLDLPDGWQVTDREGNNLKITNGTIGAPTSTRAGTATAVFDIYVESTQTSDGFLEYLREQGIEAGRVQTKIGGHDAEIFSYEGSTVGGRQEAVLIPERRVFIIYRAAFRGDDGAFFRGRAGFRRALESIRFEGSGSEGEASASGSSSTRHGPTLGNSASTASTAPVAIITDPA